MSRNVKNKATVLDSTHSNVFLCPKTSLQSNPEKMIRQPNSAIPKISSELQMFIFKYLGVNTESAIMLLLLYKKYV